MRFLVDECTGPAVTRWLREQEHNVFCAYEQARGLDDDAIISRAYADDRVLITNDKDFGEKIFREELPHRGVVLLRLDDERSGSKISVLWHLLASHANQLADRFVVVTDTRIRFALRHLP